jgi:hypothetical protein
VIRCSCPLNGAASFILVAAMRKLLDILNTPLKEVEIQPSNPNIKIA